MATTKLTDIDFMMMDAHRNLTDDEIDEINPQAAVDKTIGAVEDEHSEDESVDSPQPRCEVCFEPMPCAAHANVAQWDGITVNSIDPTAILAGAHNVGLEIVVVVGMKKDGTEYFASSDADAGTSIYYLQRGIHKLNRVVDGEEIERARQDPA